MPTLEKVDCPACGVDDATSVQETNTMMAPQSEKWNFDQCNHCSMVYLNPRVVQEEIGTYYPQYYLPYRGGAAWGKYEKLVNKDQLRVDNARVDVLLKYASENVNSLLDIGCGKPSFLKAANRRLSMDCSGIDFTDLGWRDHLEEYKTINLMVGEIDDIPAEKKYDVITMWQYMEHDYHPHETLKSLLSCSHKETRIIIEIPCFDSDTRKKYGSQWAGFHSPRHTGLFTPDTMKTLMDRSGWTLEEAYTSGTLDPYILDWMSRMENESIDWSASMESRFISFVAGKMLRPKYYMHKRSSQGFMTAIAKPK